MKNKDQYPEAFGNHIFLILFSTLNWNKKQKPWTSQTPENVSKEYQSMNRILDDECRKGRDLPSKGLATLSRRTFLWQTGLASGRPSCLGPIKHANCTAIWMLVFRLLLMTQANKLSHASHIRDALSSSFSLLLLTFANMIKALTFLAAVAAVSASPQQFLKDVTCEGADNVTSCEADLQVCKNLFAIEHDEQTRREIYRKCLDVNGFSHLDDVDPELLFSPTDAQALALFGSEENHLAVKQCVLQERGEVRPDGTVDPQPFLDRLTPALNDTRPDLLDRLVSGAESCLLQSIEEWEACIFYECFLGDFTTPVPTTVVPEE
nr:uncharacterized protein LOC113806531 [Penaeus vannamei]